MGKKPLSSEMRLGHSQIELYRRESNLAISSSPVKNNNVPFLIRRNAIV
jgi:hypothetical protein